MVATRCPHCGAHNEHKDSYCARCGMELYHHEEANGWVKH
ncbi:MAG: zinc-ribbon domain-containing protein [Candidatus Thermoplasmatota archaeon]|nr:zinc-ribbon domain-containing protein [Candidatus Thermoplasmatota archaeon]MBU1915269.1 zinc-ribbon domain-containing protein [Candidatus Thermoplasmatota archaeon]